MSDHLQHYDPTDGATFHEVPEYGHFTCEFAGDLCPYMMDLVRDDEEQMEGLVLQIKSLREQNRLLTEQYGVLQGEYKALNARYLEARNWISHVLVGDLIRRKPWDEENPETGKIRTHHIFEVRQGKNPRTGCSFWDVVMPSPMESREAYEDYRVDADRSEYDRIIETGDGGPQLKLL